MLRSIWYKITTSYSTVTGTGAIFVLFVVALVFCMLVSNEEDRKTSWLSILAMLGTIGCAVAIIMQKIFGKAFEKKLYTYLYRIFVIALIIFAITVSGKRLFAPEYMSISENAMHIPQDLMQAMDTILTDSDDNTVGVVTAAGYGEYFECYSSRFAMLYRDNVNSDVSEFDTDVREAYIELSEKYPDMRVVAKAAKRNGCSYIVINSQECWPKVPLDSAGYVLISSCGSFDVYKATKEVGAN